MDDRCVDRAPHAGFCPPEATWRTYCADVPRFWRTLQHAPAGKITAHSIPRRLHEAALAIRLQTGIRPTPSRMRIWLGRQCLIGGQGPHWGGCTYPGLLLRTFSKAHAFLAGPVIASESIYRFRHCYYAWREGYLLFSPHLSYIQQALAAPPLSKEAAGKHEMILHGQGPLQERCISAPPHYKSPVKYSATPPSYANPYPSRKDGQKTPCVSWG